MKALDKEGLDYLANKVYDAINSGGSADYIVEEGTSGIWTYRKWASGIAECWGDDTQSVTAYATILSGMQNFRKTVNLPSNLFTRIDDVNFNCVVSNTTTFPVNIGGTSTTSIDVIASALTTATTAQSFRSRMLVKGLWKEFTPSVSGSTYSPIDLQALNANALQYKKCSALNITNTNDLLSNGIYSGYSMTNAPQTGWMLYFVLLHDSNSNYVEQIAFPVGAPAKFWRRTLNGANNWSSWNVYNQN